MAFSRIKAVAWVQGEVVTPAQFTQFDINQSRAVDGTNGGAYTLLSQLTFQGVGVALLPLVQARLEGKMQLNTSKAGVRWRGDYQATISTTPVTIDTSYDCYWAKVPLGTSPTNVTLYSAGGGYETPQIGERIRVVNTVGSNAHVDIFDDIGPTLLARLKISSGVASPNSPPTWCEFEWDGTNWIICGHYLIL